MEAPRERVMQDVAFRMSAGDLRAVELLECWRGRIHVREAIVRAWIEVYEEASL